MNILYRRLITSSLIVCAALCLFLIPRWLFALTILGVTGYILAAEWPQLIAHGSPYFWLLTPVYPVLPACMIIYLQWFGYEMLNYLLFFLVAAHDTGAYICGTQWGRTTISTVSPNKTWEGFVGGFLLSLSLSCMFFWNISWPLFLGSIVPLVASINFAALAGDLFESSLKRRAGLKDSGTIFPGHGGVLDRIDGILFAVIIVFLARRWLLLLLG